MIQLKFSDLGLSLILFLEEDGSISKFIKYLVVIYHGTRIWHIMLSLSDGRSLWNAPNCGQIKTKCRIPLDYLNYPFLRRDRRGRDRMVVGLTNTYAISAYHY